MGANAVNTVRGMRKKVLTMAEYIRREDVIEWFMPYAHAGESIDADVVISDIKGMKAADVAPVVRCKDCKHKGWVQEPCHGKSVDYCKIWDCTLRNLEATFCSYGEQKDGGASDVRIAD